MKLLSGCFTIITMLSLMWICAGLALTASMPSYVQSVATQQPSFNNDRNASNFATTGTTVIAGTTSLALFLCTGIPVGILSLILALLTHSSYTSERRHQQMLAAQMQRNEVLGTVATSQLARTEMQYDQWKSNKKP